MALDADSRAMPFSASPPDADVHRGDDATNLFAPVSVENRITGNTRVRRQRVQPQLTPGSSYDYGRGGFEPEACVAAPVSEAETVGYNKSVPPLFLRRTMTGGAQQQANGYSPVGVPLETLYARAAAEHAAAAAEALGGFGAPLPFQFANRVDEPPAVMPEGAMFNADHPPAAMPFGYTDTMGPLNMADAAMRGNPAPLQATDAPKDYYATPARATTEPAPARSAGPQSPAASPQSANPSPNVQPPATPHAATGTARRTQSAQARADDRPAAQPEDGGTVAAADGAQSATIAADPDGGYAPRRAGRRVEKLLQSKSQPIPLTDIAQAPAQTLDTWELMGWKSHAPVAFENTAVWRSGELTMFERNAFDEPLDPFRNPPEPNAYAMVDPFAAGDALGAQAMPPIGAQKPMYPSTGIEPDAFATPYGGQGGGAYGAYPYMDTQAMPPVSPEEPYAADGEYAEAPEPQKPVRPAARQPAPPDRRAPRAPRAPQKPARKGFDFSTFGPKRVIVIIGCTLAIIFCAVEVGKMVFSLMENEQEMKKTREELYHIAGTANGQDAYSVELLPAGQTYAPTASPAPVATPTEPPRIAQNDPLIGVVDNGGSQATDFQAALPSVNPTAARARLTQYPDNALLSVSADFAEQRAENPDVVGRLTIDGVLDETFVQRNNTFYLTHNARGVFGNVGAVFVDESVVLKKPPENLLLRGQTTIEGKLFQPLLQYATAGGEFVAKHGIVTCNTIYEQARYVIFAIIRADSVANSPQYFNYAGYPVFQSDTQMERYIAAAQERSMYPISVSVKPSDRLLTLATLAEGSDTTNLVILCRMLRNGETDGNIQRK